MPLKALSVISPCPLGNTNRVAAYEDNKGIIRDELRKLKLEEDKEREEKEMKTKLQQQQQQQFMMVNGNGAAAEKPVQNGRIGAETKHEGWSVSAIKT